MRKIIRYFHENKQKILIIIGMLAFIIFVVHFINNIMKENNKNNNQNEDTNISKIEDVTVSNKAAISNEKISNDKANQHAEFIRNFVNSCNKKNYEEAYNFLSDDCKEVLYPDLKKFADNYIDYIFESEKIYNLELWQDNIYKIVYYENNFLTTGGETQTKNFLDYITIIYQNNELKLNISSFIKKEQIEKSATNSNITVKVNSKIVYIDYEIYNISIMNNSDNKILLCSNQNLTDIILLDKKDNKHSLIMSEIPINSLIVNQNSISKINMKFNITYEYNNEGEYIQFNNIYTNYLEYQNIDDIAKLETIKIDVKI